MLIEMKVSGLTIDPITNTPIVILKDLQENKAIPIWIGLFEASAIATELEKIVFSRPMTHDLFNDCFKILNVSVSRVEIVDIRNNI
jgi:bifunctional DNase/RNase